MGQTQAIKEAVWLKSLLDQLNPEDSTSSLTDDNPQTVPSKETSAYALNATIIYYDNQGAVALAKNPEPRARSKHIDIQWHLPERNGSRRLYYAKMRPYLGADRGWIDKTAGKGKILDISKGARVRRMSLRQRLMGH